MRPFTEDKQDICDALLETLKLTRAGQDITNLVYSSDAYGDEWVMVLYTNGTHINVKVNADSGMALVRDVMRRI